MRRAPSCPAPRRRSGRAAAALVIAVLTGTAAVQDPLADAIRSITPAAIRAHIAFLADDLLEGRAPGGRGGELAARYIATRFAGAGVLPGAGGTFFQPVPLLGWTADPARTLLEFDTRGQRIAVELPAQAVVWSGTRQNSILAAELVFAGYGVRAPEYDWDDYKGRDVRGRIVAVLIGDPPAPPTEPLLFDGRAMTYYGRWTYKLEEAQRQGAAGVLLVHAEERAGYPWSVVAASWGGEVLGLPADTEGEPLRLEGWIERETLRAVLAHADHDLTELVVRAARRDFTPVGTGIMARTRLEGSTRRFDSANVIGIVPGRHPQRRQEAVVFTSHYDHLGIGSPVDGDSVYNGAYDNASGVAVLLELAAAFASLPTPTERSLLFIATTAEEAGLLGATHYARDPIIPLVRTAAVINLDGANLWGETDDVLALGADRSTLAAVVQARARQLGLRVEFERAPEHGHLYRLDLFPFAQRGVPGVHIDHGLHFRGRPPAWGPRTLATYEALHYHRPSDRLDPAADLRGAVQQAAFTFLIGHDIAQQPTLPQWLDGAPFPAARSTAESGAPARR